MEKVYTRVLSAAKRALEKRTRGSSGVVKGGS